MHTSKELLKIFPEAKSIIREKLFEYQNALTIFEQYLQEEFTRIYRTYPDDMTRWVLCEWILLGVEKEMDFYKKNIARLERLQYATKKKSKESIDEADIAKAKATPIALLLYNVKQHRVVSNKIVMKCPFHDERTASFFIYTETNTFHCFSCSANGDAIDYVMRTQGLPFVEAVKYLRGK